MEVKSYALGLPANSIRAIVTIVLTLGFVVIHYVGLQALIDHSIVMGEFGLLVSSYNIVYLVALHSYFRARESEKSNGNDVIEINGTKNDT